MDSITSAFDKQFSHLDRRSHALLSKTPGELLMIKPREPVDPLAMFSIGEYIVRSAAMVEQTFGGITTRLWDDPFEWTLPEKLNDHARIIEYLSEVEAVRQRGFALLASDDDLAKQFPAPVRLTTLSDLLAGTLVRAAHYQGRAFAVFQMVADEKLPPV